MKTWLNYLWRLWMIILGIILTILLFIPVFLLSINKKHYKYVYKLMRFWSFGMFYGMGFRYELVKLTDKKIDPKQKYVVIANHTSLMDVMLPCLLLPKNPLCFVGKKELVNIPIFGIIYKRICVMVDRNSPKSRADVYRRCAERMDEGESIVIFPEGGVSDDPNVVLDHFKDGAFILSSKHQSPIIVYVFKGLKEMFPFDNKKGYPGKVKVYLLDVLEPNNNPQEMKSYCYDEMKKVIENNDI